MSESCTNTDVSLPDSVSRSGETISGQESSAVLSELLSRGRSSAVATLLSCTSTRSQASDCNSFEVADVDFASIVKAVHESLRTLYHRDRVSFLAEWNRHKQDSALSFVYSKSMSSLSVHTWSSVTDKESRIQWCHSCIDEYFRKGGILRSHLRAEKRDLYRRLAENSISIVELSAELELCVQRRDVPGYPESYRSNFRLKLLDVGSCNDPFQQFGCYDILAVDLHPSSPRVLKADFLDVDIVDEVPVSDHPVPHMYEADTRVLKLARSSFDVVVFSLLLSYMPSTEQRFSCCARASECLKENGLLLVIKEDSSNQNHNMPMIKSWCRALGAIGFVRVRLEKLAHLHCLAFHKVSTLDPSAMQQAVLQHHSSLFIPQDLHPCLPKAHPCDVPVCSEEECLALLNEMTFI